MDDASSGALAAGIGIYIFALIVSLAIPIICCVVVAKNSKNFSDQAWQMSGQSKGLWIALSFFLSWIGLLIYFVAIKPKVEMAQNQIAGGYGQVPMQPVQQQYPPQQVPPQQYPPQQMPPR